MVVNLRKVECCGQQQRLEGGGYFTYPPTCCLNCCIVANWNFSRGIQQYSFYKAQLVNGVKVCDPVVKTDVLRHSAINFISLMRCKLRTCVCVCGLINKETCKRPSVHRLIAASKYRACSFCYHVKTIISTRTGVASMCGL